ncbi:MAG: hypothetical protein LBH92_00415 [Bacteroidales bacterium]|nr:hypothetical protein [Bacteroidales bacterium]
MSVNLFSYNSVHQYGRMQGISYADSDKVLFMGVRLELSGIEFLSVIKENIEKNS